MCIGQDLAMSEAKLLAVLIGRKFDVEEAWDEWYVKQYVPLPLLQINHPIPLSSHLALPTFAKSPPLLEEEHAVD